MPHHFIQNHSLNLTLEFVAFPSLLRYDLEKTMQMSNQDYTPLQDEEYHKVIVNAQARLQPYKSSIDQFYFENELNVIKMLMATYELEPFEDLDAYLRRITLLDPKDLKTSLVYSCLVREHYAGFQPSLWTRAKELIQTPDALTPWLKGLDYSAETKWQLFNILADPNSSLSLYQRLMVDLKPHFDHIYEPYAMRLNLETQLFIEQLNALGSNPIAKITDDLVKDELIPEGDVHVSLSYLQAYHIQISTGLKTPMFTWGNKTADYLAHQKKLHLDATAEQVLVCKNLGDKTRYQVAQLVSRGTSSTKAIADLLGVTPATISYHLNQLVASRILVLEIIEGKYDYALNRAYLNKLFSSLAKDLNF